MKVNMTPNPLDVVTIHASQGDSEARQWEFELHNNGELIDTSDVTEQMFFKAYKGGTEQILPENTSTPTTSPFLGDIRYPQGLLTDQEFTYRQSPTEEDGLAKVTDIKGNTLVWNQLIPTNWASSGNRNGVTFTNNGDGSYTFNGTSTGIAFIPRSVVVSAKANHKYFVNVGNDSNTGLNITINGLAEESYVKTKAIISSPIDNNFVLFYQSGASFNNLKVWPQIIDLTQMGLDSLTVEQFTSLFPLSYYSYNQGSLLSFNGTGLKTVGFNQWDEEWEVGGLSILNGVPVAGSTQIRSKNFCPLIGGKTYYSTCGKTDGGSQNRYYLAICFYDAEQEFISAVYSNNLTFVAPSNASYFKICTNSSTVVYGNTYNNDICVNISSSRNGEYEPYTSSTLSLPISTYFPSGMKSAGNVYDELTESKAITRIGAVDLGTLNYINDNSGVYGRFYTTELSSLISKAVDGNLNIMCPCFVAVSTLDIIYNNASGMMFLSIQGNISFTKNGYSTVQEFKNSLQGIYLYYELATPTETSFTTASLVTENAEIPLSNNDGTLIGKCTEQLSENPGFIDAKIKLTDSDGTCYSNKLQLHVERKPS